MIDRAKRLYNPLTINSFLSKLPQGITLDDNFTLNELIALAVKFHGINPANMLTYTLPTVPGQSAALGDVLYVQQPAAQQLLVSIFGTTLITPTNPPPNAAGQTPLPPTVTTTSSTSTTTTVPKKAKKHTSSTKSSTTTTTVATPGQQFFDPVPCNP
jgi:hypothetical protein